MTLLYGIHAVMARLRHHPHTVANIYLQEHSHNPRLKAIAHQAQAHNVLLHYVTKSRLDRWLNNASLNHQGVICETIASERSIPRYLSLIDLLQHFETKSITLLALDQVHDPHNLGACLRSADAFGAKAVIVPRHRSVGVTEAVSRTACGAAETVSLITVSNFVRALDTLADAAIEIVGLAGEAEQSLWQYVPANRLCWVLGGEEHGLRYLTRQKCQQLLAIPMHGSVESLNVSVCAALCLAQRFRNVKV